VIDAIRERTGEGRADITSVMTEINALLESLSSEAHLRHPLAGCRSAANRVELVRAYSHQPTGRVAARAAIFVTSPRAREPRLAVGRLLEAHPLA
jgi:hypothetical protein